MRLVTLLSIVLFLATNAAAQSGSAIDENVILEVSIASNQKEFRIGETIPIKLSFSSQVNNRYIVNMAQYDRSGRMNSERFVVSPAEGAVDPLPSYRGSMGGLTNFEYLKPEPWSITVNLNEWVRF